MSEEDHKEIAPATESKPKDELGIVFFVLLFVSVWNFITIVIGTKSMLGQNSFSTVIAGLLIAVFINCLHYTLPISNKGKLFPKDSFPATLIIILWIIGLVISFMATFRANELMLLRKVSRYSDGFFSQSLLIILLCVAFTASPLLLSYIWNRRESE